jgi:hypothetical protein
MQTAIDSLTPDPQDRPLAADGGSKPDQGSDTKNDKGLEGDALVSEGGSSGDQGGGTKNEPEKGVVGG